MFIKFLLRVDVIIGEACYRQAYYLIIPSSNALVAPIQARAMQPVLLPK